MRFDYETGSRNYTCVRTEPEEEWLEAERNKTIAGFLIARQDWPWRSSGVLKTVFSVETV